MHATIEDMMASAGLVLRHAESPSEVTLPAIEGETVRDDDPLFYLTDPAGNVLAVLQYGWHTDVPPPDRFATVGLLYSFHRRKGLASILAALAMREAARDGPFTVGGFITNVWARNIHYNLFEESRPPMTEEEFDPDDGIDGNRVMNGQKAEAIARKYLLGL